MPHSGAMLSRAAVVALVALVAIASLSAISTVAMPPGDAAQIDFDEEVPPGNPVVGSDAPGDFDNGNDTDYGLLAALAIALIAAGALLVKLERSERHRADH